MADSRVDDILSKLQNKKLTRVEIGEELKIPENKSRNLNTTLKRLVEKGELEVVGKSGRQLIYTVTQITGTSFRGTNKEAEKIIVSEIQNTSKEQSKTTSTRKIIDQISKNTVDKKTRVIQNTKTDVNRAGSGTNAQACIYYAEQLTKQRVRGSRRHAIKTIRDWCDRELKKGIK